MRQTKHHHVHFHVMALLISEYVNYNFAISETKIEVKIYSINWLINLRFVFSGLFDFDLKTIVWRHRVSIRRHHHSTSGHVDRKRRMSRRPDPFYFRSGSFLGPWIWSGFPDRRSSPDLRGRTLGPAIWPVRNEGQRGFDPVSLFDWKRKQDWFKDRWNICLDLFTSKYKCSFYIKSSLTFIFAKMYDFLSAFILNYLISILAFRNNFRQQKQ